MTCDPARTLAGEAWTIGSLTTLMAPGEVDLEPGATIKMRSGRQAVQRGSCPDGLSPDSMSDDRRVDDEPARSGWDFPAQVWVRRHTARGSEANA